MTIWREELITAAGRARGTAIRQSSLSKRLNKLWHAMKTFIIIIIIIIIIRMWGLPVSKVKVIPVVIRALGSIPMELRSYLDQLDIDYDISILQKSAVLGTAHILRKELSV